MERRRAARYGLRVPVLFSWDDTRANQAEGLTRDISAIGAYVLCEGNHCPVLGDEVRIQLILPSIANAEAQGMKLNFKGQVLRTGDFQESGFAVLAEYDMELTTGSKEDEHTEELP